MREETRPILAPVLGIFGGALPTYWAARELWVVWRTSTKSKLVSLMVPKHTKITVGLIAELRNWYAAVTFVEALVVLSALLLLFFPRRHVLLSVLLLLTNAIGLGLLYEFPYAIGRIELLAGLVVCPAAAFIAAIAGLMFRSDLEFARTYGFD